MNRLGTPTAGMIVALLVGCSGDEATTESVESHDHGTAQAEHAPDETSLAADFPIVFTKWVGDDSALFGLDLAAGTSAQLTPAGGDSVYAVWSPSGDRVFYLGGTGEQVDLMALDASTGEVSTILTNMSEPVSASPAGTTLLIMQAGDDGRGLYLFDLQDGSLSPIDTGSAQDAYARWSGAGEAIAFESARDGNPEIYRHVFASGESMRLTENEDLDEWPSPSPDGEWIAWASGTEEEKHLWIMASDGTGKRQLTEEIMFGDAFPEWSPDGSQILLTVSEQSGPELVLVDVSTGAIARLGPGFAGTWR